jgi:serine/threonine protein kinase
MSPGDVVNGYTLLQPFTTAGGGQSRWAFARRGAREFFLKEFLAPTYPEVDAPGSAAIKRKKLERCQRFERHHRGIIEALAPLSGEGGNLVVTEEFFRVRAKYYKVTAKVDVASIGTAEIAGLPIGTKIGVLLAVTHSLRILHRAGLVHGDIKPGNVLIKHSGPAAFTAKLIDFDNCFLAGQPPPPEEMVGDVTHYSPELMVYVLGEGDRAQLEPRSDVFALGLVFAQYLTGALPGFDQGRYVYAADAARDGGGLAIRRGHVPDELGDLVDQMLAGGYGARPSCDEVYRTLKRLQSSRPKLSGEAGTRPATAPADGSRLRGTLRPRARADERPATEPPEPPGPRLRGSLTRREPK